MNSRFIIRKCLVIIFLSIAVLRGTVVIGTTQEEQDKSDVLCFDAAIELYAPSCKSYVVLFARYWVSSTNYRMALIWSEPHTGSFNFPIYAPTMNVASDAQNFIVEHQFKHEYDGIFPKPIQPRGPFLHKFNTYAFSDIRFAEQEALDLRIHADDINLIQMLKTDNHEINVDINNIGLDKLLPYRLSRVSASASKGFLNDLQLLDPNGTLLKSIDYEYADREGEGRLLKQTVLLPEQPITVGFKGKKPVISINGIKKEISEFQAKHHIGGRECVVDYELINLGSRKISLPVNITVRNDKSKQLLRSAKLYNYKYSKLSSDQIDEAAKEFSYFTESEMKCREMLVKYWVIDPAEVEKADVETMKQLLEHFSKQSIDSLSFSEQLRHVNVLLQLDWMLGRTSKLENDFRDYMSLLASQNLDRLMLTGGQNAIDLTCRWGQYETAEKLLGMWANEAVARNNTEVTMQFAYELLGKRCYWISVRLMDRLIENGQLSPEQRFIVSAIRSFGRERLYWVVNQTGDDKEELKEPEIIQANWISNNNVDSDIIEKELVRNINETKKLFTKINQPAKVHKTMLERIEKIDTNNIVNRSQ